VFFNIAPKLLKSPEARLTVMEIAPLLRFPARVVREIAAVAESASSQ